MLTDTFDQLYQRRKGELRRPLRVRLGTIDELQVGQDLGGVQMEFFNLLCREILDEQAGMFTTEPSTGCSYFRPGSLQPLHYFKQFGVLLALAMYNGITLPITLPKVFYHFLINGTPTDDLHMLDDGWPEIARSLLGLTDEDAKDLDFTFDLNANGVLLNVLSPRHHHPNHMIRRPLDSQFVSQILRVVDYGPKKFGLGDDISLPGWSLEPAMSDPEGVTDKELYIREKLHWHTYLSVWPQLRNVLEGFSEAELFPSNTLQTLFTPSTLKLYTEGTDHLDINELRATAAYTDYDPRDEYIQAFWRIVGSWEQSKQKQLLKFVTAAERIPISGPRKLVFRIKRADHEEHHLPTSHTCFGTLDLPEYESEKLLEERLSLALKYGSEGFGMG